MQEFTNIVIEIFTHGIGTRSFGIFDPAFVLVEILVRHLPGRVGGIIRDITKKGRF